MVVSCGKSPIWLFLIGIARTNVSQKCLCLGLGPSFSQNTVCFTWRKGWSLDYCHRNPWAVEIPQPLYVAELSHNHGNGPKTIELQQSRAFFLNPSCLLWTSCQCSTTISSVALAALQGPSHRQSPAGPAPLVAWTRCHSRVGRPCWAPELPRTGIAVPSHPAH